MVSKASYFPDSPMTVPVMLLYTRCSAAQRRLACREIITCSVSQGCLVPAAPRLLMMTTNYLQRQQLILVDGAQYLMQSWDLGLPQLNREAGPVHLGIKRLLDEVTYTGQRCRLIPSSVATDFCSKSSPSPVPHSPTTTGTQPRSVTSTWRWL